MTTGPYFSRRSPRDIPCVCCPSHPTPSTLPLHSHPPSTAQQMQGWLIIVIANSDNFNPFFSWFKLRETDLECGWWIFLRKSEKRKHRCVLFGPSFLFWRSANVTHVPSRVYVPMEWEICVSDLVTCSVVLFRQGHCICGSGNFFGSWDFFGGGVFC